MTIILYDIASSVGAWAPNPWKTRIALNYKGVPYKTEWVQFHEITATVKKLGAAPGSTNADGSPKYTLPVIFDPKTGKYVSESFAIAEYLDATYPELPTLFPPGSKAAIALWEHEVQRSYLAPFVFLIVARMPQLFEPAASEFARTTREAWLQSPLEAVAPPGPKREARWEKVKEGLTLLAGFLDKNGKDKPFFFGDTFSFAEIILAAFLAFPKTVLADPKEWETLASWNDGRWGRLVEATAKYQSRTA